MRQLHSVGVTLLFVLGMLAGCSGDDSQGAADSSTTSSVTSSTSETTSHEPSTTSTTARAIASLDEIEFLMPSQIPPGWALGHATQRVQSTVDLDGRPIEVSDYTVVWRPDQFVGASRSESTSNDAGASLGLNAGSAYYNETFFEILGAEPPDAPPLEDAEVRDLGDHLELRFMIGCCVVSLTSDGIDPDDLRAIGKSVTSLDPSDWKRALGDRLLVDDQTT